MNQNPVGRAIQGASNFAVYVRSFKNWPEVIRNRFGLLKAGSDVTFAFRSGLTLSVRSGTIDAQIIKEVIQQRMYTPSSDFELQSGWTVLDLGAHKGVFSVSAAQSVLNGRVFSVEPEPENYAYLLRNVALNSLTNVTTLNAAVWSSAGRMQLRLGDSWDHSLCPTAEPEECGDIDVDALTLDELARQAEGEIDLLKMDIEGAELPVLMATSSEVLSSIRRIVLEYHPVAGKSQDEVAGEIRTYLERHNFRCFTITAAYRIMFAVRHDVGSEAG